MRPETLAGPIPTRMRGGLPSEFVRYGAASVAGLALDYGVLVLLTEWAGLHYAASAAIGFSSGVVFGYFLSVRYVFDERRVADRRLEFLIFFSVSLVGLALTYVLLCGLAEKLGINYVIAKVPTAGAVFVFNFTARRLLLFSRWPAIGNRGTVPGRCSSEPQTWRCRWRSDIGQVESANTGRGATLRGSHQRMATATCLKP